MYKSVNNNSIKRYFDVELQTDEGKTFNLSVESPKMKTLSKMTECKEPNELAEVTSKILSKNKSKTKISIDDVNDIFEFDELVEFISDFSSWLGAVKANDPN